MNADNTSTDTVIDGTATEIPAQPPKPGKGIPKRTWVVGALALPLAFGAAGLSLARNGTATVTPVEPVAIQALVPSGATAIKGDVAEIFGNKFVCRTRPGGPWSRPARRAKAASSSPRARASRSRAGSRTASSMPGC